MIGNDFNIFKIDNLENYKPSFGRKDLYRICLIKGKSKINYNDQSICFSGTYLFFGSINTPYSWEVGNNKQKGYTCLFTQDYLKTAEFFQNFRDYSPFNLHNIPLYHLKDQKQVENIKFVFERMFTLYNSDFFNRKDMIKILSIF